MPILTLILSDAEVAAVAAGLSAAPLVAPAAPASEAQVLAYLDGQLRAVVGQHIVNAKRASLKADGLPEKLADAGLDDDDVAAIKAARAAKRAALEAARG